MPFFVDEIHWFALSQWSFGGWNKQVVSCLDISVFSCVLLCTMLLLSVSVLESSWKNSPSRNFLQNQNKLFINLSLLYRGISRQKLKLISQMVEVVFLVCWIWLNMMIFSVYGRTSWMLPSFESLNLCSAGVKLFISWENLFVISIEVVFSNSFLRRAERRGINHLCWSSDVINPVVVVLLYFTLNLYFGNVVNVHFSKQSTRCWHNIDWSWTIFPGFFTKRMSIEHAFAKNTEICGSNLFLTWWLLVLWKYVVWREKLFYLLQCLNCWMSI